MGTIVLIRPDIDKGYPFGKLPAYLPLGLGFIAGALKKAGYTVVIIDCYLDGLTAREALRTVISHDPLFVGITAHIASTANVAALSRLLVGEGYYVVVGGPQVTVFPEKTIRSSGANVGIVGEGEQTILEVAERVARKRYAMDDVAGVVYLSGDACVLTARRAPLRDLDSLPFIPWELFPYARYAQDTAELERSPLGWMSTSRGCPWDCSFCSNIYVWGREYRCMSPERIIAEMIHLHRTFGINAIDFREDNFTVKRERVLRLCALIRENKLDVEWMCESRVDIVDDELLRAMSGAGCRAIYFGIESGTQRVLDYLHKGFTLEDASRALGLCRKHKIKTIASVMLGVPTQTREENAETIAFLRRLRPDMAYFNPFIGIPGSKTYEYIIEKGLVYKKAGDILLANSEFLSWREKLDLKQKAELAFNLSPGVFIGHLKRMGLRRVIKKGLLTLRRYFTSRKTISRTESA